MRAAVFLAPGRPLDVQHVPDPEPGEGQVLLRVHRCGICGSDLHMSEDNGMLAPPGFILGHERSAEVIAVGKGVERLKTGDHVVPHPLRGCGKCVSCRLGEPYFCELGIVPWFGGFAEYMTALEASCVRLPKTLSLDDAAIIEPLAVGLLGIQCNPFQLGAKVLVIGAGPIGVAAAFWARLASAGSIAVVASSLTREPIARAVGVDAFFVTGDGLKDEVTEFFGGPPDIVLECIGIPGAIELAVDLVKPRGSVNILGICEHRDPWVPALALYKELRLQFAIGTKLSMFEHAAKTLDRGVLDPVAMITDIVSFDQLPEAFEALKTRTTQCKVVFDPKL